MTIVTITDDITGEAVTVAPYDIAEALAPWYADAPADVAETVSALEDAALRGDSTDDLAQFLAVTVRWNADACPWPRCPHGACCVHATPDA